MQFVVGVGSAVIGGPRTFSRSAIAAASDWPKTALPKPLPRKMTGPDIAGDCTMSGWAGIDSVIVGGVTTEVVVDDVRIVEVEVESVIDLAELVEPHAESVAAAAKNMPAAPIALLIACLAPPQRSDSL